MDGKDFIIFLFLFFFFIINYFLFSPKGGLEAIRPRGGRLGDHCTESTEAGHPHAVQVAKSLIFNIFFICILLIINVVFLLKLNKKNYFY